jgi:hypothetical protein
VESVLRAVRKEWDDASKVRLVLLSGGTILVAMWFLLGGREPNYASAAWSFLFPLAGFTISSVRGGTRTVLEGLLSVCILWMFFSFLSQELFIFGDRVMYSRHFTRAEYYEYPAQADTLPAGATVVNLGYREANYPLVGTRHTNRVIKFESSLRLFGLDANPKGYKLSIEKDTKGIHLDTGTLRRLGATHLYVRSKVEIAHDACVRLREVGRLDRNPVSGARLDPPKVLYELEYCTRGSPSSDNREKVARIEDTSPPGIVFAPRVVT